jgi:L-fucono-1,5-lactonase
MIIDAHHHLWDPARREYPWMAGGSLTPIRRAYTVDDLRAAAGPEVSATVLVQTVSSVAETEEFLTTAAASGGLIAGVVGWVDLTGPDVAGEIDRLGPGLVGVRHQVEDEPDPEWLLRNEVLAALRRIADAGLPYDLLVRAPQRPAALTVAARLDDVHFVLDHAGKPAIAAGEWDPWATWLRDLARLPNVSCKLSGLITEAPWDTWKPTTIRPYANHILDCFGSDRVLFGSDWPVCELAGTYPAVLDLTQELLADLTNAERSAILSANAIRSYRLTR